MSRDRDLKGIACGLAETFVSRNNDVSGYWGIGMLYRELLGQADRRAVIDLAQQGALPDGPVARALLAHYRDYLARMLARGNMALSELAIATITVEFGTFGACREPGWLNAGPPFVCSVTLGKGGRPYTASRAGRAVPHDPAREARSNRAACPQSCLSGLSEEGI